MKVVNKKEIRMTILQVAEQKHKKMIAAEKKNELKKLAGKKHKEHVGILERFIVFESEHIPKFFELSGPLTLYMYMRASINRKPDETWGNLGKYFTEGFLATGRTQSWLANQMGVSQQNLSNWFSKLEKLEYIKPIGREILEIENPKTKEIYDVPMTIYALGEIVIVDGYTYEVLYYEQ